MRIVTRFFKAIVLVFSIMILVVSDKLWFGANKDKDEVPSLKGFLGDKVTQFNKVYADTPPPSPSPGPGPGPSPGDDADSDDS